MRTDHARPLMRALALALAAVCLASTAALAGTLYSGKKVEYVGDGDTIKIIPPISGSRTVRLVNIDAPEIDGDTQEPWATASRDYLRDLLPDRTRISVLTDVEELDFYGRVLGHVTRESDGLGVNRDLLRQGHASTYVVWPNVALFEDYRQAQIAAQSDGLGIWDPAATLTEQPFEYRLRTNGTTPSWYIGDWFTGKYVQPTDWDEVHVNNRVWFVTESDALDAGFTACPTTTGGGYDQACFASGS